MRAMRLTRTRVLFQKCFPNINPLALLTQNKVAMYPVIDRRKKPREHVVEIFKD